MASTAFRGASDDIRRWIAEILLLGVPREAIVGELVRRGWQQATAEAEVRGAAESPYLQGAALLQQRIAKRDWILASIGRLAVMEGGADIDRTEALPAAKFFRDYYSAHRPVIITGLAADWPALELWSLDYFEERLGEAVVEVQVGREANPAYERESFKLKREMRFGALIAKLREDIATNDFYLTAKNGEHNRKALAPLWEDIGPIDGYLSADADSDGYFWLGPKGTITPFHHDLTNNLLVQLRGRKRVVLVPSWDTPKMLNFEHCFSGWQSPEALAELAEAERPAMFDFVLQPGEALFIPVGWWHHVTGLDVTVSMSFTNFARPNDFHVGYTSYGRL
jgi:ribosomal protein L16 Arg81 hydroxylase